MEPNEASIRRLGLEMFSRAKAADSSLRPDWWVGKMLDWVSAHPRRKLQMFRFVDTLPALKDDKEIVGHLAEYLLPDDVPLPSTLRRLLKFASSEGSWLRSPAGRLTRFGSAMVAKQFIAAETPSGALKAAAAARRQRMGFTIDVLGEATASNAQADRYAQQYIDLIRSMAMPTSLWRPVEPVDYDRRGRPVPRVNVSIKLSSLDPHFDPADPKSSIAAVFDRLFPILRAAREEGVFVNIDMEQHRYKDLTLEAFRQVIENREFRDFEDIGIVIQAYLRSSPEDLGSVLEWVAHRKVPVTVRLVKGAYWDCETAWASQYGWPVPVETEKWRCDSQFESLARMLLDHRRIVRPAFASHNVRSLASILAWAETAGAMPTEFELQMLYGMGDPLKKALVQMGQNLRVYMPFGALVPGMAYLIRRMLENTANESFLQHGFGHDTPGLLLVDPADSLATLDRSMKDVRSGRGRPLKEGVREIAAELGLGGDGQKPFRFEPLTDFSQKMARESMSAALKQVRGEFGKTYRPIIDGEPWPTKDVVKSTNPSQYTEIVGSVCFADTELADKAVETAKHAFKWWSKTTTTERASKLRKIGDIIKQRRFELAAWIVFEAGKPWREADADVSEAVDFCNYYAQEMERLARPRRRDFPGEDNGLVYLPRGVTAVIAPWNFPLAILAGMTSAAFVTGNTVVMKPAEQTPVVAAKLMEIFGSVLPPGVVNYLPGRGEEVGARLVEHPDVNMIAFTGSRKVGNAIRESAARNRPGQHDMKRVIAEMGGKNAIIVDSDADMDEAVVGVVQSAFGYAGQKCSACSRAIVHKNVADEFKRRLWEAVLSIPVGPAELPNTVVGPVIDGEAYRRILSMTCPKGGSYCADAHLPNGTLGHFVLPKFFFGVPPDSAVAQEEIFGPVLVVIVADDFDDAVRILNGTAYALTGGLYSRSPDHIERAKREFEVGNLYVNRNITGALVDRQPFGGYRMSGTGPKAGGPDYLIQFMEPRTVVENTMRHGFSEE